ncbi:MAG TPA: hypothetical protein VHZ98_03785 [Galbitalea sp.]|nr:hypothetical protein [Galbitalea sp.]
MVNESESESESESEFVLVLVLVPGGNIAIWPEVKLGRAYAHIMELQQRIEEWESLRPLHSKATQVSENELSITVEVHVAPPLEALATIFGDAIHNLRSALDAATWEMANFEGRSPATEDAQRAVHFPLYDDNAKFQKWADRVGSIPDQLLARLEAQQPYNRAAALAKLDQVNTLVMLHSFDITDKHRNSISAVGAVRDFATTTVSIKGDARELTFAPEARAPLETGAVLLRAISPKPIELIGFVSGPITAQFDIPARGGFAPVLEVLGTMAGKVRVTLDGLYSVESPPDNSDTSILVQIDAGRVKTTSEPRAES